MKPETFNYADHLRLQAEMDKHNEYTNALKAANERLKAELTAAKKDIRKILTNLDNDICAYCKNEIKCEGKDCDCYEEGKGVEMHPDFPWTCEDFDYGTCKKMKGTKCEECFDRNYSGFEWKGVTQ